MPYIKLGIFFTVRYTLYILLESFLICVLAPHVTTCSQSPVLSDQVLLDIPHVKGVMFNMFNIRFTYLKIADVT